jgi:ketosteroid isomerase-like protein
MSREHVEVMRAFTQAFNEGDVEGVIACCDPDVEFHSTFAAVGGADYHRHEGVRRWYRGFEEEWGAFRSDVEAVYDLGEHLLTFTTVTGRGKQSDVEVELPAAIVTRLGGGRFVYFKGYAHREDALRDLGVSEDDLSRTNM